MNYVAAIDLGTTKIVTLVAEKSGDSCRIIAYKESPSKGVMRGEPINIKNVVDIINDHINQIKVENHIKITRVYVGIAGQNIKCTSARLNRHRSSANLIELSEIRSMILEMNNSRVNEGEKILHVIPQSYNVDNFMGIYEPEGMNGTKIEGDYKLFIGKKNSIDNTKMAIERAGLELKEVILEPIASACSILSEDEKEIGVAMVDIGGGTTDVIIFQDNIIRHVAVIPFGGNSVTEDLRQGCGISYKNAEKIKLDFGHCHSAYAPDNKNIIIPSINGSQSKELSLKFISKIIEARMEEILEAVLYEIERSGYIDKISAGIVFTGGGSLIMNLKQLSESITGLSTRIAYPDKNISFDTPKEICKPATATAIGLAMYAMDSINSQDNYNAKNVDADIFSGNESEEESPEPVTVKKAQKDKTNINSIFNKFITKILDGNDNRV